MDNKPSTELYFVLLACKKEKPSKFVFKCNEKENEVYFYKGETSWEILFDFITLFSPSWNLKSERVIMERKE